MILSAMHLSEDDDVNDQIFIRFPVYFVFLTPLLPALLYCTVGDNYLVETKPSKQTKVCAVSLGKRRKRVH